VGQASACSGESHAWGVCNGGDIIGIDAGIGVVTPKAALFGGNQDLLNRAHLETSHPHWNCLAGCK